MRHRRTRIKICCVSSEQELDTAVALGADAVGLVAAMPSGPGVIDETLIAELARRTPPGVSSFLLTSETDPERIQAQHAACGTSVVQLTDWVSNNDRRRLRSERPGVRFVQVVHVVDEAAIEQAREAADASDALLLDSGDPTRQTKVLGGTGRPHDWSISRRIVDAVNLPVYLAGGLHPGNARDAIETARPFGLDLCTGVRRNGHLDAELLASFMEAVREP